MSLALSVAGLWLCLWLCLWPCIFSLYLFHSSFRYLNSLYLFSVFSLSTVVLISIFLLGFCPFKYLTIVSITVVPLSNICVLCIRVCVCFLVSHFFVSVLFFCPLCRCLCFFVSLFPVSLSLIFMSLETLSLWFFLGSLCLAYHVLVQVPTSLFLFTFVALSLSAFFLRCASSLYFLFVILTYLLTYFPSLCLGPLCLLSLVSRSCTSLSLSAFPRFCSISRSRQKSIPAVL